MKVKGKKALYDDVCSRLNAPRMRAAGVRDKVVDGRVYGQAAGQVAQVGTQQVCVKGLRRVEIAACALVGRQVGSASVIGVKRNVHGTG